MGERILRRLAAVDRNRLATVIIVVGTGLALVMVLFAGFFPASETLVSLLYPLAILFPLFGVGLVVVALWWTRRAAGARGSSLLEGERPESGSIQTERPVGRETGWLLDKAANEWYRCREGESSEKVRNRLVEGAVRTLKSRLGLDHGAAVDAVRSGTWTDDPVAAAFLADDLGQPFTEWLRAAIDPGAAHHRRVRHTLDAIEEISEHSKPVVSADRDVPTDSNTSMQTDEDASEHLKQAMKRHEQEDYP